MAKENFQLEVASGDKETAYLYLRDHGRGPGSVVKQVRLRDVFPDYSGADVYLDLDADNRLIGIEVLL